MIVSRGERRGSILAASTKTIQITWRRVPAIRNRESLSEEQGNKSWADKTIGPTMGKEGHHQQVIRK